MYIKEEKSGYDLLTTFGSLLCLKIKGFKVFFKKSFLESKKKGIQVENSQSYPTWETPNGHDNKDYSCHS